LIYNHVKGNENVAPLWVTEFEPRTCSLSWCECYDCH